MAQLVARLHGMEEVGSSSLPGSTRERSSLGQEETVRGTVSERLERVASCIAATTRTEAVGFESPWVHIGYANRSYAIEDLKLVVQQGGSTRSHSEHGSQAP